MKYDIKYSSKFKKHYKKLNIKEQQEARAIIESLANDESLEPKYKDHALKGDFLGFRECHIKPDLLLIYQKQDDEIILYCLDIGSHSELF
ncbi:type II toxin-antitoxin system YafQ family toxin [Campylobacter jejuni]|uniref:type II toxin-antitoxin system YafQ family toxin n=1 Tax=Campylobacter jejuni TaxID=197 RepID=UPI00069AE07C|nr:type II toxin-antitoxin system YafQ family toxin [Campylobacter jejuni]ECL1917634.1 type II toxin-antitoxin system YafQ family toxin [Campylobacter jejuni]ECL1956040.1 type II toxin-antitoxin system YafQ family toxin [Campylobacter jejuni]ECL1957981.1 type II toxin-antitoxin system YafQ family toxin [Campylobacter jejuni]ECO3335809.1 type II toxin-antitoxin system YafQ family toxin [Campylobacter jejuni]ECQ5215172.1 type II toxin-antitoxin system YafQ family toxin [Campylobacter jejuni]